MKTRKSKGVVILQNSLFFIRNSKQHLYDTKNFLQKSDIQLTVPCYTRPWTRNKFDVFS